MSSQRLVLPGLTYHLPPPQDKLCMLTAGTPELQEALKALPRDMELSKALLGVLQGVSPVVCREIAHRAGRGRELTAFTMDEEQRFRLGFFYQKVREMVIEAAGTPHMAVNPQKKPMDFSFLDVQQYGTSAVVRQGEGFSQLLDDFYREKEIGRAHV